MALVFVQVSFFKNVFQDNFKTVLSLLSFLGELFGVYWKIGSNIIKNKGVFGYGFKRTKIYEYCLAIVKWWVCAEKFSETNLKNISKMFDVIFWGIL